MSVIFLLISASTLVAGVFLVAFIWAVRRGQFDDDLSPAVRILDQPIRHSEKLTGEWSAVNADRQDVNGEWSTAKGPEDPHSPVTSDHSPEIDDPSPFTPDQSPYASVNR